MSGPPKATVAVHGCGPKAQEDPCSASLRLKGLCRLVELVTRHANLSYQHSGIVQAVNAASVPRTTASSPFAATRVTDRLSTTQRAAVLAAYANKESPSVLATQFGISRQSVINLIDEAGLPRQIRRMSDEQVDEAIRLYESGFSIAQIVRRVGFSSRAIWHQLNKHGVQMRDSHGRY